MFTRLSQRIRQRSRERGAIDAAVRFFESARHERVIRRMSKIVAADESRWVVQVCHGGSRPPGRAFFAVGRSSFDVTSLSFEEVSEIYEIPAWR